MDELTSTVPHANGPGIPTPVAYCPTAHAVHTEEPVKEYRAASQGTQLLCRISPIPV